MKIFSTKKTIEQRPDYVELKLDALEYASYQRDVNVRESKKIADHFKWNLFGLIFVSYRDGHYYVVDGQHRVEALKLNKLSDKVMCAVWRGLTYEEECREFIKLNTLRKSLNYNQIFHAMVEMKDADALSVTALLQKHKFEYAKSITGKRENTINAMNTVFKIYKKCGEDVLDVILYVLRKSWHGDPSSLTCRLFCALKTFLMENENVNINLLIEALKTVTPEDLELTAIALAGRIRKNIISSGSKKQIHISNAIKFLYNEYVPKNKRIA